MKKLNIDGKDFDIQDEVSELIINISKERDELNIVVEAAVNYMTPHDSSLNKQYEKALNDAVLKFSESQA